MEPVVSILQLWNIQGICIENHKFQNDYCLLQILNVMLGHAGTHLGWHSKELSWIILIFFAFPKDSEKRRWSIFNWCGMLLAIWHFLCWKLQDHAPRSSTLHSAWSGWTHGAERKTVAESLLSTGRPHVSCQHIASVGAGEPGSGPLPTVPASKKWGCLFWNRYHRTWIPSPNVLWKHQ